MKEDELNLWERCRNGDEAACDKLILSYLPLVKFWVRRISRVATWANRDDLIQEGIIGLIKAARKFDPARGVKFTTHARHYIREAIYISPEVTRGLSRRQDENYREVRHLHDDLMRKTGRKPTFEETAEAGGLSVDQVENALASMSIAFPGAITDALESVYADEGVVQRQESIIISQNALSRLSEQERAILILYYWADRTDLEIAKQLSLTGASVSQIRYRAIKKLKRIFEPE
jgi:RNA polymerase sigma factor (sigma-70 family)